MNNLVPLISGTILSPTQESGAPVWGTFTANQKVAAITWPVWANRLQSPSLLDNNLDRHLVLDGCKYLIIF